MKNCTTGNEVHFEIHEDIHKDIHKDIYKDHYDFFLQNIWYILLSEFHSSFIAQVALER